MFGEAIEYDKVRLKLSKWWPFHPRGARWRRWPDPFPPRRRRLVGRFLTSRCAARPSSSTNDPVWQAQKGGRFYLPLMRHPFCRYRYRLRPGKPFDRYGLEQQAELVANRFLASRGVAVAEAPPVEMFPFAGI